MSAVSHLRFALPKGRLAQESLALLRQAGLPTPPRENGRRLVLPSSDGEMAVEYVLAKPWDVPIYVEYGAADLGICGLDVLREGRRNVHEPLLLPFGHCRLSLAGPASRRDTPLRYESQPRVATKYPRLTRDFFVRRGINAEVIALNGSVELGPMLGLADLIVDLVQTGSTLRANGLVEFRTILESQAVLIVNRAAYRLKATPVQRFLARIRSVVQAKGEGP